MGCGGSREATPQEQQLICTQLAKEMMLICVDPALEKPEELKIPAPPEFDTLKNAAASLRRVSQDASSKSAEDSPKPGGVLGALQGGLSAVAGVASQGLNTVLGKLADGLEAPAANIEAPFSTIAADVVKDKYNEIAEVLCAHIAICDVPEARALCHSQSPTAISDLLIGQAAKSIAKEMMPKVGEAVNQHAGLRAWNTARDNLNSAKEKVKSLSLGGQVPELGQSGEETAKFDLATYVCEQTVLAIGKRIGEQETANRLSPEGKAKLHPEIFVKVFTKKELTQKDFKQMNK